MEQGLISLPMEYGEGGLRKLFDVKVFNLHAPSNKNLTPSACYKKHDCEKKWAYEQCVRAVEHSSFTLLVLAVTGGLGIETVSFYKRLASMLPQKWDSPYSTTLCWLHCHLSFSLLCSLIQAIRGAKCSHGLAVRSSSSCRKIPKPYGPGHHRIGDPG